jgi:hypothetical protein
LVSLRLCINTIPSLKDWFGLIHQLRRFELQNEFINAPVKVIDLKIREGGSYYAAYRALENDEWAFGHTGESSYLRLKQRRKHQLNPPSHQRPGSSNFNASEFQKEVKAARDRGRKIQGKIKTLGHTSLHSSRS